MSLIPGGKCQNSAWFIADAAPVLAAPGVGRFQGALQGAPSLQMGKQRK